MSDKQTQCKQIVAYIREKGHITTLEAYQKLKVTQLAARITDLESAGFVFAKPRLKVDGCRHCHSDGVGRLVRLTLALPTQYLCRQPRKSSCPTWRWAIRRRSS